MIGRGPQILNLDLRVRCTRNHGASNSWMHFRHSRTSGNDLRLPWIVEPLREWNEYLGKVLVFAVACVMADTKRSKWEM